MTTAVLLLPVLGILVWLYWYLLPGRRWRHRDSLLVALVLTAAALFLVAVERMEFIGAGPLWPLIVATAGAYGILACGLAAGLAWRRRQR